MLLMLLMMMMMLLMLLMMLMMLLMLLLLLLMMMMMRIMTATTATTTTTTMMMCERAALVPTLCVPLYNMNSTIMQKRSPATSGKTRGAPVELLGKNAMVPRACIMEDTRGNYPSSEFLHSLPNDL